MFNLVKRGGLNGSSGIQTLTLFLLRPAPSNTSTTSKVSALVHDQRHVYQVNDQFVGISLCPSIGMTAFCDRSNLANIPISYQPFNSMLYAYIPRLLMDGTITNHHPIHLPCSSSRARRSRISSLHPCQYYSASPQQQHHQSCPRSLSSQAGPSSCLLPNSRLRLDPQ